MKQKTMNYLMLGAAGIGVFFLLKGQGTLSGYGCTIMQQRPQRRKRKNRMPRHANRTGSPMATCTGQLPPQRCSTDFEVVTTAGTFGDCGMCGEFCC